MDHLGVEAKDSADKEAKKELNLVEDTFKLNRANSPPYLIMTKILGHY